MGWMLKVDPVDMLKHAADLRRDRIALWCDRHYWVWVGAGIAAPALLDYALTREPGALARGALWGGFVRIFLVQHVTWSINSICHLFGTADFATGDESRNNALCALLSFGEGWHNNHHAFPYSVRHGLLHGQLDLTYLLLAALAKCGVVWDLRLPNPERVEGKMTAVTELTPPSGIGA